MDLILQDLRHSFRSLRKSKLFTLTAIFCLTLSVGAVSSMFSALNGVVLDAFPFKDPYGLVDIQLVNRNDFQIDDPNDPSFTMPQRALDPFLDVSHSQPYGWKADRGFAITDVETPFSIFGCVVSTNYFGLVGPNTRMGRLLNEQDKDQKVAIISHRQWSTSFGADPAILGTNLTLNGERHTIVGVLERDHRYPAYADIWVPEQTPTGLEPRYESRNSYNIIGRLIPGQSVDQMNQQLLSVSDQFKAIDPGLFNRFTLYGMTVPTLLARGGQLGDTLQLLMAAVIALLLIASANVANLMLSRMQHQEQELSLRAALGARRGRLVRRLLMESGLIAVASSILGVLLAYLILPIFVDLSQGLLANPGRIRINSTVLIFSVVVTIFTTLLVSLAPLLRVIRSDLAATLRTGGNKGMMGGGQQLRQILVTSEAALTFVLLVGAGLMIKSFQQIQSVDMGFETENMQTIILHAPASHADSHYKSMQFYEQNRQELAALPGIVDVAFTHALPVNDRSSGLSMSIEEFPPQNPGDLVDPAPVGEFASDNYLQVLGVDLVQGRYFTPQDNRDGREAVIISENMARHYWPNESAIGKRMKRGTYGEANSPWWEIVGVVKDVRSTPTDTAPHKLYRTVEQHQLSRSFADLRIIIRTETEPGDTIQSVRSAIQSISADSVINSELTMRQRLSNITRTQQMAMNLVMVFSAVGLILAIAGIFGVFSYNVQQRFREIGLRMVLGAKTYRIFALVLKSALILGGIGIGIGLLLTLSAKQYIETYLYEVSGVDPIVYGIVTLILLSAIIIAACEPARRATKMDPVETLRHG